MGGENKAYPANSHLPPHSVGQSKLGANLASRRGELVPSAWRERAAKYCDHDFHPYSPWNLKVGCSDRIQEGEGKKKSLFLLISNWNLACFLMSYQSRYWPAL